MNSAAFLVRKLCIGGQLSSRGAEGQEIIEHFSGTICHYTKGPSFGAGPLLLRIDESGVECSRALHPARIQQRSINWKVMTTTNAVDALEANRRIKGRQMLLRVWREGGMRYVAIDTSKNN